MNACAAAAGELLTAARAELAALADLSEREQLWVAVWLVPLRSARTRRVYLGDLAGDRPKPWEINCSGVR